MQEREWTFVDKSTWGDGPWLVEPDKVQWEDADTGVPCLAVRNLEIGQWCGYVGVAEGHPFYMNPRAARKVDAHGGVNFFGLCAENDKEYGVCHVPAPGEPEHLFWIGFDCAHAWDYTPGMMSRLNFSASLTKHMQYRTLDYVKAVCTEMAKQVKEAADGVRGRRPYRLR